MPSVPHRYTEGMRPPTNEYLGELLGVSHAMVSRYRSGDRLPSVDVMQRMKELYDWSIDDQVDARNSGTYAEQFSALVNERVPAA